MNLLNNILLSATPNGGGNPLTTMAPVLIIIAVFYFLMIRPQAKRMKAQKKFLEALSVNDPVITIGGIYGTIRSIGDTHIEVEVCKGTILKLQRGAISTEASQALKQKAAQ